MENNNMKAVGQFKDRIYDAKTGKLIAETDWSKNTIVNNINKAIAFALAGKGGLCYWAIGSGQASWDDNNLPSPSPTDTQLVNEIGRKVIPTSAFKFLDAQGNVTSDITNILQITLTFNASECNGDWREFAIVGGNATNEVNTGIIINHKIHKLQSKTENIQIERSMRFTFNNNN